MELQGRNVRKTCLSILLVIVCFMTSFSFYTDSESKEQTIGIVRFKSSDSGVVKYTEVDTGRAGYFNCGSAGDAAYLRTESDGSVICKLAGVVMKVNKKNVKEIVSYKNTKISYYYISDVGYLIHCYTYPVGGDFALMSIRVGYKPSYLTKDEKYYSYDGHYFYSDFAQMISDYQNNTYNNAVNAHAPYYNYYQYLSFHTTAPFSAEQYNAHVAAKKEESVMLTAGKDFLSAQKTYTINSLLMFGVAINESNWGTNKYSTTRNNIFSINAPDSNPDNADTFETVGACINEFAYKYIHKGYLKGTDYRYRGPHLGDKHSGMNVKYASDPYWGEKAAARGYYLDTNKDDYGRYTIGIATSGKVQFYKEASTTSNKIYTSEAGEGSGQESYLYDYPVVILDEVTGSGGEKFYKVLSDMSLKDDRSARNVTALYKTSRDYVYVKADDIRIVFENGSNISKPSTNEQAKTHGEVLAALNVISIDGYLTGFSVGSDVETILKKVKTLDSDIKTVVKKADGTKITKGTVATGMTISITTNGSAVKYTIVIRGDVNGDGKLSAIDYVMLRNHLDKVGVLKGAYVKSVDTNDDGKTSAIDYVILRNHLDKKSVIVQ